MDMTTINSAFRLCFKGADLEEKASLANDSTLASQNRKLAAQHYTQAVELLLSVNAHGPSVSTLTEMKLTVMDRLERLLAKQRRLSRAVSGGVKSPISLGVDPAKG